MKFFHMIPAAGLILTMAIAAPAMADHDHHRGKKHDRHHAQQHCPPGLAKKGNGCRPPGHAKKQDRRDDAYREGYRAGQRDAQYGRRVGDRLRVNNYSLIRDPSRYDLPDRRDWRYYQDGGNIYRVDTQTQQILAVMSLVGALFN